MTTMTLRFTHDGPHTTFNLESTIVDEDGDGLEVTLRPGCYVVIDDDVTWLAVSTHRNGIVGDDRWQITDRAIVSSYWRSLIGHYLDGEEALAAAALILDAIGVDLSNLALVAQRIPDALPCVSKIAGRVSTVRVDCLLEDLIGAWRAGFTAAQTWGKAS